MSIFSLFISLFLFSCSSIYYYPTQKQYYVDPTKLNPSPEIVKFQSGDGTELEGWYFKTTAKNPKGFIVHFHGNAQNLSTHFGFLWFTPREGYDYFIFDYRGYGYSNGTPSPKGLVLDGHSALAWVNTKRKERGNPPLIVFCQSLGGAVCMKTLAEEKDLVPEALIIDSSFASYRSVARTVVSNSWLFWLFQPVAWLIADNSQSPLNDLPHLKAKKFLVVHGEKDQVIDVQHGQKIFKNLPEPKDLWLIPNGVHTDFLYRNNNEYRKKFLQWLESNPS